MAYVPLCDTEGCDQAATNPTFGGFHFCEIHINDKTGRKTPLTVKPITLRLPQNTWERLREQAHVERTTMTALILESIEYTHMRQSSGEHS